MTQKELLYFEDAILHENNIIKICEETKNNLKDEKLIIFIEKEIKIHQELKNNLLTLLKEVSNG